MAPTAQKKPLKKSTGKRTAKKVAIKPTPKKQWRRPSNIHLEVLFEEGNRKITPADLQRAAEAAAVAARTVLESARKPYSIAEINGSVDYTYVQSRNEFTA